MTITRYDGVAILPKRCDKCNRLFWLESYNIFYKAVGIGSYSLKQIECKECISKAKEQSMKTYEDIYNEFCEKFPNAEVEDYRPADPMFVPQLMRGIPNAIIVWLKDGSKVIYIVKEDLK